MVVAAHPDPVAMLAAQRLEDDQHGEDAIARCLFGFKGEGPLVPMIPGAQ
ncbi:MAG TPA: hypothetical protein VNN80_28420 [Polyangiaceae bacterium]|nr:hypothetical protein [Polyangiaceae bacterium]